MLARTAAFDKAIAAGAPVVIDASILRGGSIQTKIQLQPGATVTLDETAAARRTFKGQVADTGNLAPHVPTDPLYPGAPELVVKTGLMLPSNPNPELVQLGIFRLNLVQDDSTGLITLTGTDRSSVVAAALNESPYTIIAGTPLDVAIGTYLAAKYPSLPFVADPAAHAQILASTVVYQPGTTTKDPWSNCIDLATQFGRELYIDTQGQAILRVILDPTATTPCWQYVPGQANMAISGTHVLDTTTGIYNVAVVSSSGTGVTPPVTASAEITDRANPAYPDPNGFGRRPLFYASDQLTTTAQCLATAQALIHKVIGALESVDFTAIPHPCHEPGDVVTYKSTILGLSKQPLLSAWTLQVDLQKESTYKTRLVGN
ncbi:MAG: DUF5047 domain-containing protein [Acidimicrobiales bacterium]